MTLEEELAQAKTELEAAKRMVSELLGQRLESHSEGKISDDDAGDIPVAVGRDMEHHIVIVSFPRPVAWLGLPAYAARRFAISLLQRADDVDQIPPAPATAPASGAAS